MTFYFDKVPLDWSDRPLQELHGLLYRSIWIQAEIIDAASDSGLEPASVFWGQPARLVWRDVLDKARMQGVHRALLEQVKLRAPVIADRIDELLAGDPVVAAPFSDYGSIPAWKGFSNGGNAERLIVANDNTLLGIAFLRAGLEVARSVCRILVAFDDSEYYASGFNIGNNLLLTNHHVLHDWANADQPATRVEAWFNYELDWYDRELTHARIECDPASIVGEHGDDWSVIRTASDTPPEYPPINLQDTGNPKIDDRVYIIQHPDGLPKMIGMHHNVIRYVDSDILQYWTDTRPGSSGSPVFNERWQLIGLHHSWVEKDTAEGTEYRNQGSRIERVRRRMQVAGVRSDGS